MGSGEMYRHLYDDLLNCTNSNKNQITRLYKENEGIIREAKGSKSKHQAWPGGFIHHNEECCYFAFKFYSFFRERGNPFELRPAIEVLLLHDIEKPWKQKDSSLDSELFKQQILEKYEIKLTEEQQNAMKYIHGENEDYDPYKRVMNEMSGFCHVCDILSSRVFHDFPKGIR